MHFHFFYQSSFRAQLHSHDFLPAEQLDDCQNDCLAAETCNYLGRSCVGEEWPLTPLSPLSVITVNCSEQTAQQSARQPGFHPDTVVLVFTVKQLFVITPLVVVTFRRLQLLVSSSCLYDILERITLDINLVNVL